MSSPDVAGENPAPPHKRPETITLVQLLAVLARAANLAKTTINQVTVTNVSRSAYIDVASTAGLVEFLNQLGISSLEAKIDEYPTTGVSVVSYYRLYHGWSLLIQHVHRETPTPEGPPHADPRTGDLR